MRIINITGPTKLGYNLTGFSTYALGMRDLGVEIEHEDFWDVMMSFLAELNADFSRKLKRSK